MSAAGPVVPGHVVIRVLKETRDGRRRVLQTRWEGRGGAVARLADGRSPQDLVGTTCVTRILRVPVAPRFDHLVRRVVVAGGGSMAGLPEDATAVLEGYRVRASLGPFPGLPVGVDAGVVPEPGGSGVPYVTTTWVEGSPLDRARDTLPAATRMVVLLEILEILGRLHLEGVVYGDLKPQNVVVQPGGETAFIDLDTLRSVGDERGSVPCTDRTPAFAAPEQREQVPHLTMASDRYAFGLLAAWVLSGDLPAHGQRPAGLPAPWDRVVTACLARDPRERPPVSDLLRMVATRGANGEAPVAPLEFPGGGPGSTERVADRGESPVGTERVADRGESPVGTERVADRGESPVGTERVADRGESPVGTEREAAPPGVSGSRRPSAAAPRRRRRILLVLGVLLLLVVGAAWGIRERARRAAVRRAAALAAAETLLEDLREHKTLLRLNNDDVLDGILARAEAEARRIPEAPLLGVLALAHAWRDHWHWSSARWDPGRYEARLAEAEAALQEGETPTARLARALVFAGGCRRMPDAPDRRAAACREAAGDADRALARLGPGRDRDWLRVEASWVGVMVDLEAAARARQSGDPTLARRLARRAVERCDAAEPWLDGAPVNGPELLEDCLLAAGALQDYARHLRWADALLTREEALRGEIRARTLRHVVRSVDPACSGIRFEAATGLPRREPSDREGGITALCKVVGTVALGCGGRADAYRTCAEDTFHIWGWSPCRKWVEAEDVPWDEANAAIRHPPRTRCAARR